MSTWRAPHRPTVLTRALFWVLDRIDRRVCRISNDLGGF